MKILRTLTISVALLAGVSCVGSDDDASDGPSADCESSAPNYAQVAAFTKCTLCHSSGRVDSARNHAPPEINFDSYEAASVVAEEARLQVSEGRMPPPASNITLTSAEKQQLVAWVSCGAKR